MTFFEKRAKSARASVESATDKVLLVEWTLFASPHKILSDARDRNFVLYHLIHHRAQLTVCTRLK